MKSTSIHNLNADKGLGFFQKIAYLFLNWVNNLFPYWNVDRRLKFKNFRELNWESKWDNTHPKSSAARKNSDLFWQCLPWEEILRELGEIHVFDTGCGSGNYGDRLMLSSGGRLASYTGVDARKSKNWPELVSKYPNFKLIESSSDDISSFIPRGTNLFITQSAIEHFDNDLQYFEQIRSYIKAYGKPVIQIHLFPAGATLPLYLLHGLRQYTPRTISKITRLFDDSSRFYLFGLGGKAGKSLHFKFFTLPVLLLRKFSKPTFTVEEYEPQLRQAVEYDSAHSDKSPLFWALIIHSNPREIIW